MKKYLLTVIGILALISSCSKPTPPPPAPYTNAEIASMYWKEYVKGCIAQPDSFNVFSEDMDSVRVYIDSYLIDIHDTVMVYKVSTDYSFKNEFGGWSRVDQEFIVLPKEFVTTQEWEYTYVGGELIVNRCSTPRKMKSLEELNRKIDLRTARWDAYQDSIKSE